MFPLNNTLTFPSLAANVTTGELTTNALLCTNCELTPTPFGGDELFKSTVSIIIYCATALLPVVREREEGEMGVILVSLLVFFVSFNVF